MNGIISLSGSCASCRRCWLLGLVGLFLLWAAGCRSVPPLSPEAGLRWPPAPAPARVAFVQSVYAPHDLGAEPHVWQKALNLVTGGNRGAEPWSCPFAVCLGRAGDLCFTDTDRGEVVCANTATHELRRWNRVGTNVLVCPVGVACASGLVYIADSGLGRVLIADRQGRSRGAIDYAFQRPVGVAVGPDRIFVVDSQACRVQVFTGGGVWRQTIGTAGGGPGEFNRPTHVAVDGQGRVYVTDSLNCRVQVFDAGGRVVGVIGGAGNSSGHFGRPKGVGVDRAGRVWVVDAVFGVLQVFDPSGRLLLDLGEPGQAAGQFWLPAGIAVNDEGLVAVADSYNRRLQLFRILPVDDDNMKAAGNALGER